MSSLDGLRENFYGGNMEIRWNLDGIVRVGGVADDWGRIPDTGFLGETRCPQRHTLGGIKTPGVSKDTECLTPTNSPRPELGNPDDSDRIPDTGFLGETRCLISRLIYLC